MPQMVNEKHRLLIRDVGMADKDCAGLADALGSSAVMAEGTNSSKKRQRHTTQPLQKITPKAGPSSSGASTPPSTPSPPPIRPKQRRLNPESASFFMRLTYEQVAQSFDKMSKIIANGKKKKKPRSTEYAFKKAFPQQAWVKETTRRHFKVYRDVGREIRLEWLQHRPNHPWANFYDRHVGLFYDPPVLTTGDATESEVKDDSDQDSNSHHNNTAADDSYEAEEGDDGPLEFNSKVLEDLIAGNSGKGKEKVPSTPDLEVIELGSDPNDYPPPPPPRTRPPPPQHLPARVKKGEDCIGGSEGGRWEAALPYAQVWCSNGICNRFRFRIAMDFMWTLTSFRLM